MHSATGAGAGHPAAGAAGPAAGAGHPAAGAAGPAAGAGHPAAGAAGPAAGAAGSAGAAGLADPAGPAARRARLLTGLATAGIGGSILIMIAASVVRDSWMYPPVVLPAWGPPWDLQSAHVPVAVVTVALWLAVLAGLGGVITGLAAVRLGARPSVRGVLTVAALAVVVLTVLPPAGSTDAFDYAAYGRILALGHSPYVTTPYQLRLAHNAFARSVPVTWQHVVSVYEPLATLEQFLAAKLGGVSAARIAFWLKLWSSLAFGLVAFVADRLLPAVRALAARRDGLSADSFYHALLIPSLRPHLALIATAVVVAVAVLTLRRLPDGIPERPAVRAALALSVAWLFFWPYQFPWYDTMIICLLVLYPASRLDWLVLVRVAAATIPNIPGNPGAPLGPFVGFVHHLSVVVFTPLLLLGAAAGLVTLCLTGNWKLREPGEPPGIVPGASGAAGDPDPGDATLARPATR
jgi:hypothetical protein